MGQGHRGVHGYAGRGWFGLDRFEHAVGRRMTPAQGDAPAGAGTPRRVFHFNGGFLWQRRVRRILHLAGYDLRLGWPSGDDLVAVWGRSPVAARGEAVAARTGAGL